MSLAENLSTLADAELLSALIELSSEAVWVNELTTGKRFWLVSETNRSKYNIPTGSIGAEFWRDNIHPNDLQPITLLIDSAIEDPSVRNFECQYKFRGAQNTWYVIRDKIQILRDANGKAIRLIGVWNDFTTLIKIDEKKQELLKKLENDKNRFKIISEFSNAVMWEVDLINGQVHWTSGTRTLEDFGLTKSDYSLKDWEQSIHPDDKETSAARFEAAVQSTDGIYIDEYRIVKSDGSLAYVIDRGLIIRDDAGNAISALGGWVDVTPARQSENNLKKALQHQEKLNKELASREEELASSEEELRQLNEQLVVTNKALIEREQIILRTQQLAKIGSWEFNPHEQRFIMSGEVLNIHGVGSEFKMTTPEEVISFYDENQREYLKNLFREARINFKPFELTTSIRTPLGHTKWVRICGWPVKDSLGEVSRIYGLTYDITFLKESEELLRTSEEKFSKAFHRSPDLTIMLRASDWIIVDINNNVWPMMGYTRQELLGVAATSMRFFAQQIDREYFFATYAAERQVEMEATLVRKDGSEFLTILSFNTVEFSGQQHIIATIKDISDRKAAEDKFTKAFELSPDLMLIFRESDFVLVECNNKVESMAGFTREEVLGKSSLDFDLWAIDADRKKHNELYFTGDGNVSMETLFLRKDRSTFYGSISTKRISLRGINHLLIVVRDTTERKKGEQQLLESEANLYATINNTNLLVWSVDLDFRVIKANKPFTDYMLKHYNTKIEQGKKIIPPDNNIDKYLRELWTPRYARALKGEHFKLASQHDNRHVEFSISPIIDNTQIIGISVFAEDISKRVQQDEELKEAMNKIAELKLMALRSVMNPHFIFNALNSIQFFIAQNDRKNAINYLSTFSRLVRGILTHSVSNKISLREEIEQLENYIALEQIRFEDKFDYTISIDPNIDLDSIDIPPLLIQPYVENAILHGLYNKESKGLLSIIILKEDDEAILVEVRDNGVGRTIAQALRARNFPTHKSMGTSLTEERLKLINAQYKVSFEIIDLMDETGQPSGTSVKIWVSN